MIESPCLSTPTARLARVRHTDIRARMVRASYNELHLVHGGKKVELRPVEAGGLTAHPGFYHSLKGQVVGLPDGRLQV